jgi:hypothetical protein
MRATDGAWQVSLLVGAIDRVAARAVIVSTFAALAIAAFLLARRAAGAFVSPLPVPQLFATAMAVVVWALIVRQLSPRSPAFLAAAIVVLFSLALACSYPGSRVVDWLIWPAAMFAVVLCPALGLKDGEESQPLRISPENSDSDDTKSSDADTMLQQISRVRTFDGCETVHGTLVAEFAAGERQTTLYVAFCPPFERLPQVEANVSDESEADVKLSQVLHNGAQFDVRLPEAADDATNVTIEFFAADSDARATD